MNRHDLIIIKTVCEMQTNGIYFEADCENSTKYFKLWDAGNINEN